MTKIPPPAVLFDIDGTLIDSNYLHVHAWVQAFDEVGHPIDAWRVHRGIGMDSAKLLEELLADQADQLGDDAKAAHQRHYSAMTPLLRPFTGARDLLAAVSGRGLQVVLATSAPQVELTELLEVLDVGGVTDHITCAEDVDTAKPAPDILQVALTKAGVTADRAVMIGDSIWDGRAAQGAGVTFVGLLSGGFSRADLTAAGAVAVYDSPAELLHHLDRSPISTLVQAASTT